MRAADRRLLRLFYETRDWCRAVQDAPSQGTHRPERTVNNDPAAWRDA